MQFIKKILSSGGVVLKSILDVRKMTTIKGIIGLVVVVLLGIGGYQIFHSKGQVLDDFSQNEHQVTTASVLELASKRSPLPLIGTVTSVSEATIRAEGSGEIVSVYHKLGDFVPAGGIIAEIENSRERAGVAQAEALLKSAEASAGISLISGLNQADILTQAKVNTINTLLSAYDSVDDGIRTKIDPMFSDASLSDPKFLILISNNQLLLNINFERLKTGDIWKAETSRRNSITVTSDLQKEINQADTELRYVKALADDIALGLNQSAQSQTIPQATIDAYKVTVTGVRTSLSASLASLSAAKDNLTAKQAQYDIAQKQSGAGQETTSNAAVEQAQASLQLAEVNLEKTIIRSPISGTLNSFSLERGDFVTSFQEVAVVSNNGALEIRAYITEGDAREIAVGAATLINDGISGVVTRVAPALDPNTKKIEVRIGITGDAKNLVNGESIQVAIERKAPVETARALISLPISAIKIATEGPEVFTIEGGVLKGNPVTTGALLGESIVILNGVTGEMVIVTDARGLKAGDTVTIKQ